MLRQTFAALAFTTMVGCSANSNFQPFAAGREEQAQLAAYAASTPYPHDAKIEESHRAGALIDPKSDTVEILNFSDQPMRDVNVWVNGTFLRKVDVIPSHGTRTVTANQLYDASGHTLAALKGTPSRVELQADDRLWSLMTAEGR
jgi:hypothetical protein